MTWRMKFLASRCITESAGDVVILQWAVSSG